jgi:TPR repeat protein
MKKDNVAYLLGGLAFGFLVGFGTFHTIANRPEKQLELSGGEASGIPAPAGPMAATQVGQGAPEPGGGGAPMVQEINALKRTLAADPGNSQALVRLGNLYQDIGQWESALGFYEKALVITPNDPNLLTDMGTCYLGRRDAQKAIEFFDRAHAADPKHWQSLFNKAVVLGLHLGRVGEAEAVLEEVEREQPGLPEIGQLRQALSQARGSKPAGS